MIILKQIGAIRREIEKSTEMKVEKTSFDVSDKVLQVWMTIYDSENGNTYIVEANNELDTLKQFSNDLILRTITRQLYNAWWEVAKDNIRLH